MKNMNDKALKGIIIIAVIIIIMAALTRMLTSSETLSEYAEKHPEQQISVTVTP